MLVIIYMIRSRRTGRYYLGHTHTSMAERCGRHQSEWKRLRKLGYTEGFPCSSSEVFEDGDVEFLEVGRFEATGKKSEALQFEQRFLGPAMRDPLCVNKRIAYRHDPVEDNRKRSKARYWRLQFEEQFPELL